MRCSSPSCIAVHKTGVAILAPVRYTVSFKCLQCFRRSVPSLWYEISNIVEIGAHDS